MKINLTEIYNKIESKLKYVVVLLLFALFFTCRNANSDFEVAKNTIKQKQLEVEKEKKYVKDLEKDIFKYKSNIAEYQVSIIKKQNEISAIKKETNIAIEKAKKFSIKQQRDYFSNRYATKDNQVKTMDSSMIFNDTISHKIITDLIGCDAAKEELKITKAIVEDKTNIITSKDSIISNKDKQKLSLESAVKILESINSDYDKTVKQQQKELRAEKRKTTLWKLITVATIFGSSYLIVK